MFESTACSSSLIYSIYSNNSNYSIYSTTRLLDVLRSSLGTGFIYVLYTSDIAKLVEALGLGAHLYADDTQLYGHCSPSNSFELASRVLRAIDSIHEWMSSNRLSLNTGKTQFIWLDTKHSLATLQERYRSAFQSRSIPDRTYIREESWLQCTNLAKYAVRHSLKSSAIL